MKALRLILVVLVITLVVLLPVLGEDVIRLGVVTPSSTEDASFSESLSLSLDALREEMGANLEVALTENLPSPSDAESVLRQYAADGYDLVLAHGAQYVHAVGALAAEFPDVVFIADASASSYVDSGLTNILLYDADTRAGAYVVGVLAGTMTTTGQAGFVGSVQISSTLEHEAAFRLGVLAAKPEATVTSIWIDSFTDTDLAAAAAATLVDAGADVLTGISQAAIGAIEVAQNRGAYWFAAQADPSRLAPSTVIASFIYDWTGMLRNAVEAFSTGSYRTSDFLYTLSLGNGGIRLVANPQALAGLERCEMEALMWRTAVDLLVGDLQPDWAAEE